MKYIFENIQFNSDIPIKIFIHNLNYAQNHWHDALEILFVLNGNIQIGIGNSVFHLQNEDLIVINPHEIHTTYANHANLVLVLQISSDWINKYSALKDMQLCCNSCINNNRLHMDIIRRQLAQMMWVYNNQSSYFELKLQSYLFELLYQLFVYFQIEKQQLSSIETENLMPRLSSIIYYLHENYDKNITLQELADREYLSVSYISRFFKKNIGISFKEYVIRLRLEHAVKELLYTNKPISQLALDNGFPNTNSFLDAFKEYYKEAPSVYRKKAKQDYIFLYGPNIHSSNYFELADTDIFSNLYKYLNWNFQADTRQSADNSVNTDLGEVDLSQNITNLSHTWKNLLTIGKAKDALDPGMQEQLTMVQKELGFRYIRFHGIFDDEMMVYNENSSGDPCLDFHYVDQVIDFLYSIDLKPFIELGFMPLLLAKDKNTMFKCRPSIISMPKDMQKWCCLIRNFILHCMDRYGEKQVEEWYFEFWNEPDITEVFWYDSMEDYFSFYAQTYSTVKSISKNIRIGGPAVCKSYNTIDWLQDYFEYCTNTNCLPDFFTFHYYLHTGNLLEVKNSTRSGLKRITLSNDPDDMYHTIENITKYVAAFNYDSQKIHLTEWNASPSHRDLSHDTLFMASFIVKNILENMDALESFGFWTISDFIEEFPIPKEYFHGGLGLITYNGIKKAGYYAFCLLNHLGDKKIASGSGYYITSDGINYQILLYNYCHYDQLYCNMDHSGISYTDRYGIYKDANSKNMKLTLRGFRQSNYEITEYAINRSHGSSFDSWIDMGAPENLTPDKAEYLRQKSIPNYTETIELIDDVYSLNCILAPHEIRLIQIKPLD